MTEAGTLDDVLAALGETLGTVASPQTEWQVRDQVSGVGQQVRPDGATAAPVDAETWQEVLHFRAQTLNLFVDAGRRSRFERGEAIPQALVFLQQLLGELLALVEQLEKLLSSFFSHGGFSRTTKESSTGKREAGAHHAGPRSYNATSLNIDGVLHDG